MVLIRSMQETDLDQVLRIEQATFPSPWRRSFFLADIHRPDSFCIVAENEAGVAGYLIAWGKDEVHIANIAVAEAVRNQGIGTELMKRVLAFAHIQGADNVYLEVRISNTAAQRFYRRFGFIPTYIRRGYYENGEDALVMERDVKQTNQK
ncbi:MAG: ribosomal protein S18-alanine N-acetyltransferase [bacterium]